MRAQIKATSDSDWLPLFDQQGEAVCGQDTYGTSFCIGDYEKAFTLIIQRTALSGQASLDLASQDSADGISLGGYTYRAIATNRDELVLVAHNMSGFIARQLSAFVCPLSALRP